MATPSTTGKQVRLWMVLGFLPLVVKRHRQPSNIAGTHEWSRWWPIGWNEVWDLVPRLKELDE